MSAVRREVQRLWSLATPTMLTQLGMMLMGTVDVIMVGRVGVDTLASASLGRFWVMGTAMLGMGLLFGLDPILSQAHGARDSARLGLGLQRGFVLGALLALPMAAAWWFTAPVLVALRQDPGLAAEASRYVRVQIPSIPFFLAMVVLRGYLQCRGIVRPTMWVVFGGNVFNAVTNYLLIFGHAGFPALGLVGAGITTALTRMLLLGALLVVVRARRLTAGGWVPWSREALRWSGLRDVLHYGVPISIQLNLEMWAFQIATLFAGRLGTVPLAAHTVALNLASVAFMMPLGVALAAVTRVGNLIGARRFRRAQLAAQVALGLGAAFMSLSALAFAVFRFSLPKLYNHDPAVVALAAAILPVAAAFQIFDGLQVVGGGILRGMGRTRPAAVFNLVAFYVLAIPLAWLLGFRAGFGIRGVWWGLCLGLGVVALSLVLWISRHGPASLEPRTRSRPRATLPPLAVEGTDAPERVPR